ncbi:threonine aldolase family protein [Salinarimonas ramus]|uniref:L-threonine aldolase n=1 Tax=Salinarimonas ramus TaxID=690164 RepID=A0A917Q7U7_9HYPH|nr:low specificity L-threonine aldolase [Salinarimonas ramus]GGK29295.1 L-threonine aldolase [Salinarimonas ramus]
MNFASDNIVGASRPVLDALVAANEGAEGAYGTDRATKAAIERLGALFERDCAIQLVATGTAANALALSALVPPYGAALCHVEAHVMEDECGAPEFFAGGMKLLGLPGAGGKIAPRTLADYLAALPRHEKQMPPRALTLSQATEYGLVYTPSEIAALCEVAHEAGLKVHMDGARFANALVSLNVTPAEMTWKLGIDVLTFGATKNGCLAAEAVIFFDPALAEAMPYLRKRSGHTLSKGRLLGAQLEGYLGNDHWLDNARHANAMAARLAEGVAALPGARLAVPREANEVFPVLPRETVERLRAAGAVFHPWSERSLPEGERIAPHEMLVRLVASFATTEAQIEAFLQAAKG